MKGRVLVYNLRFMTRDIRMRYFLAEIKGPEQKSDSEAEKGLQMLLDSDLPALKVDFLELQKPN
ncbi:uncharacterized protein DS421_13g420780 [Arachis hypogaea]|nr:uncharacterized protein DS421_13g420780 [Arachis hypogaea]